MEQWVPRVAPLIRAAVAENDCIQVSTQVYLGGYNGALAITNKTLIYAGFTHGIFRTKTIGPIIIDLDLITDVIDHGEEIVIAANEPIRFHGLETKYILDYIHLEVLEHRKRRPVESRVRGIISDHVTALATRRRQLVRTDIYGVREDSAWQAELRYFWTKVVAPTLDGTPHMQWVENELAKWADEIIDSHELSATFQTAVDADMDPREFEVQCAESLKEAGWEARLTAASGDQGVDVIATKGDLTVAIQCKLYSRPVGNRAVQEALAGMAFIGADVAVVVSNAPYTAAAKQLAASTSAILLHYSDLPSLDQLIDKQAAVD